MPSYDYKCKKCGERFEVAIGNKEVSIISCPICKSMDTKKVISSVSVMFRGKGFYSTDNPKGKK